MKVDDKMRQFRGRWGMKSEGFHLLLYAIAVRTVSLSPPELCNMYIHV